MSGHPKAAGLANITPTSSYVQLPAAVINPFIWLKAAVGNLYAFAPAAIENPFVLAAADFLFL
jgi:hypothetical protein